MMASPRASPETQKLFEKDAAIDNLVSSPTSSNSSSTSVNSSGSTSVAPTESTKNASSQPNKMIEFNQLQPASKRQKSNDDNSIYKKEPPSIISHTYLKNIQRAKAFKQKPEKAGALAKTSDVDTTITTMRTFLREPTIVMSQSSVTAGAATKSSGRSQLTGSEKSFSSSANSELAPSLSSKLIISSVISTQQQQQQQQHNSSATSAIKLLSPALNGHAEANTPTMNGSAPADANNCPQKVGQAVSARLMDMGRKLLEAAREGQVEEVRELVLSSGAPFTCDWLGTTALHLAAQNGHLEIAEILLKGGVNRDARTKLERTALHYAAQSGNLDVVDLLLLNGSDVNASDMLKMTPLHWAVERNHYFVAERLLLSGADATYKNKFHMTPIEIAQRSHDCKLILLFKNWIQSGCIDSSALKDEFADSSPGDYIDPRLFNISSPVSNHNNHSFLSNNTNESHNQLDYRLSIENRLSSVDGASITSLNFDITEPCIDLVEFELNTLKFEPDFFLSNENEEDENGDETRVEYLMKVVEQLQQENKQLRQTVEQLQTTKTQ